MWALIARHLSPYCSLTKSSFTPTLILTPLIIFTLCLSPVLTLIQNLLPTYWRKAVKIEFNLLICRDIRSIDPRTFVSAYVLEPIICEFCAEKDMKLVDSFHLISLFYFRLALVPKTFIMFIWRLEPNPFLNISTRLHGFQVFVVTRYRVSQNASRIRAVNRYMDSSRAQLRYILAEKRTSLRPFRFEIFLFGIVL